jgi:DUF1009 family protein
MLALIAGTGDLPGVVARRLIDRGDPPLICAMLGFAPTVPDGLTRLDFRIETLGTLLTQLQQRGVNRVCMAGAMRRPVIDPAAIDAATAPLAGRIMAAMGKGDDGTLRALIAIIEQHGFAVVGAADLVPDLLPAAGVPSRAQPGPAHAADAATGADTVAQMGAADLGQACIVRDGEVLAREDDRGTDAMLAGLVPAVAAPGGVFDPLAFAPDLTMAIETLTGGDAAFRAAGAILFKAPKPQQDRRADLPTIGPDTARGAVAARLAGLVIEAGGVMVLDLPEVLGILDAQGLFLWLREAAR